jgi:hypothetical protein
MTVKLVMDGAPDRFGFGLRRTDNGKGNGNGNSNGNGKSEIRGFFPFGSE